MKVVFLTDSLSDLDGVGRGDLVAAAGDILYVVPSGP